MKVSGFTFLRNGQLLDYPFIASIQSLLPLVDEMIIALGPSTDATLEMLQGLAEPKIRVVRTNWCDNMRNQGFLYGQQKMIAQYNCTGDWAFYLEADEVLHEKDIPAIRKVLQKHVDNPNVEALVFDYLHFYGSPGTYVQSHRWYPKEARVIKTSVRSTCPDNLWWDVFDENGKTRYPKAALANVPIYHYGWLRKLPPSEKRKLQKQIRQPKTSKPELAALDPTVLLEFNGAHPKVVHNWLTLKGDRIYKIEPYIAGNKKETLLSKVQEFLSSKTTPEHFELVK